MKKKDLYHYKRTVTASYGLIGPGYVPGKKIFIH
ncbi:hypothetical protein BVRB_2g030480 [Beta vulgaris subsp. vulgaris]|nr:hypothetical protein BVRB_2g030480 [Beta vulgaris subsp. vulgaris]